PLLSPIPWRISPRKPVTLFGWLCVYGFWIVLSPQTAWTPSKILRQHREPWSESLSFDRGRKGDCQSIQVALTHSQGRALAVGRCPRRGEVEPATADSVRGACQVTGNGRGRSHEYPHRR